MARFWVGVSLFLLAAFSPFQSFAQQPSAPQRDPLALSVIAQSLETMGLTPSLNLRTLSQGSITYADQDIKAISIETAGVDRFRSNIGANERSFVANAGNGFMLKQGSRYKVQSWMTQYKRPDHLPGLAIMAAYLNPQIQIIYVGLESVNGSPAHHLQMSVIPVDGTSVQMANLISEFHVYIDQVSLLIVKTKTFDLSPETPDNRTLVENFFSNYQNPDGTQLPFQVISFVAGHQYSEIDFTSISLNASIPDSDFQ